MPFFCAALCAVTQVPRAGLSRQPAADVPADRADLRVWHRAMDAEARGVWPVFVRADDGPALRVLETLGIATSQGIWTLTHLDSGSLHTALGAGNGLRLRTAPSHHPLGRLIAGPPDLLAAVQPAEQSQPAPKGAGVLIGFVDTGIDLQHPAFFDAQGNSRVVALWDQDAHMPTGPAHPGAGHSVPPAFGYGHACSHTAIAAGTCPFTDPLGHGTHVASIAAGSDPVALGIAPKADIAVVRAQDFTQLADAVAFLYALADTRGQPLVVNISVGGHYGPHDGRTPLEDYLNSLVQPGRGIVVAAGNDGAERLHAEVPLGAAPLRMGLRHLPCASAEPAFIEFWSPPHTTLDWALELWRDDQLVAALDLNVRGEGVGHAVLEEGPMPVADVTYGGDWASEHGLWRHALVFSGRGVRALQPNELLALRFIGSGVVQGWVGQGPTVQTPVRFASVCRPGWLAGDSLRSIAVPATALGVVTVGSYTVASTGPGNAWPCLSPEDGPIGDRSAFSSRGPTGFPQWTGLKPNLCAPGSPIVGARGHHVPDGPSTLNATQMVMRGTSMAAPQVTGTVAQLLERDPTLEPQDLRELLQRTAQQDDFTGDVPNLMWGAGKLNGATALAALDAGNAGCQSSPGSPVTTLGVVGAILQTIQRARQRRQQAVRRQATR